MRDRTPQPRPGEADDGRQLALYYAANVLFAAGLFSHAFLYNFYLSELGHGAAVMGLAAAGLTAGGMTALVPAGGLVDRLGARWTFVGACVLAFAGLVLGAFARSAPSIGAAAFVAGAGTATWRVSMGPLLMRMAGRAARTRAFSWNVALLLASGSVWTAASGLVPAYLAEAGGLSRLESLRVVLVVGATATLFGGIAYVRPGAGPARESAAAERAGFSSPFFQRLRESLSVPRSVALFVAVVALWMTAGGLVIPYFNVFFVREHGLAVGETGVLLGVAQAVTALAVFSGGWIAGRAGPRRMLLVWAAAFAPLLWGLAVVSAAPMAAALFVLQGFVPAATNPLIDQLLLERTPPARHGAVSTWRNAATETGGMAGAAAGGVLLEATSFGTLFLLAGFIALLGVLGLGWAVGRIAAPPLRSVAPVLS